MAKSTMKKSKGRTYSPAEPQALNAPSLEERAAYTAMIQAIIDKPGRNTYRATSPEEKLLLGYEAIVQDRLDEGWSGSLLTIMFNPLLGPYRLDQMTMWLRAYTQPS